MRSGLVLGALGCALTGSVVAQQGGEDVLAQARVQLQERHLDSTVALLRRITDSTSWNDSLRRIDAFVLLGIVRYYQGADSASRDAFTAALTLKPTLLPPRLAQLDSALGVLFDSARVVVERIASRDALYSCSPRCRGLDVEPRPVETGARMVPFVVYEGVPAAGVHGSALLRAIVDTLGRVEPGSVEIVYSTLPREIERTAVQGLQAARYYPGRAHGRAVRVLIEQRIQIGAPPD
jgi:hypothetical protein